MPFCRTVGPVSTQVGYSGTPLPKKLGIAAGRRVLLVGAPAGFALGPLPDGVELAAVPAGGPAAEPAAGRGAGHPAGEPYDVVLAFCPDLATLEACFADLAGRIPAAGALWICWPKRASGVATDLTENTVRDLGLAGGLVDVKVAAVDATWSGLKFVYRLADRPR
jgi:hypothetical protein